MKNDLSISLFSRLVRFIKTIFLWICLGLATLWAVAALFIDIPIAGLRIPAAAFYAMGILAVWIFVRSPWKALITGVAFLMAFVWWQGLRPSNDRDWQRDVAILSYADIQGDQVILHNIRNCDYRTETDYDVHHYDKSFDIHTLRTVDLYLVTWGSLDIAHTMISFGFADGDYVCFSIETRKENGENYSALKGLFRQFELMYVVADERDLVRLRTNYRQGEEVCLYRLQISPEEGRQLFLEYLKRVNALHQRPEWYHALVDNCTTAIRSQRTAAERMPWDWRILINGHLDTLLYERDQILPSIPFATLKEQSHINNRAKAADPSTNFSQEIRQGLPGFSQESASPQDFH